MIDQFGDTAVHVSVISKGRPGNVERMQELLGGDQQTWIVPEDERWLYGQAGARHVITDNGGLCPARNLALDTAFALDAPSVQVSDDLTALDQLGEDGKAEPISFEETILALLEQSFNFDARLAGTAPTSNPFYASRRTSPNLFIVGDLMLVHPNPLRFDTRLRLKEDYDYTCQHFAKYATVARVGWLLPSFRHRTNPGGAVTDRTVALEHESIALLKEKWPGWVRDNARRPNEILLKLPKPSGAL